MNLNNITWYKNLTWNPPAPSVRLSSYIICARGSDSSLLSSESSCFTFFTLPKVNEATIYPVGSTFTTTYTSQLQEFRCSFNVDIAKPIASSYIRIYSKQTNLEVLSIDTLLQSTNQITSNKNMNFNVPIGLLTSGDYYILFDSG